MSDPKVLKLGVGNDPTSGTIWVERSKVKVGLGLELTAIQRRFEFYVCLVGFYYSSRHSSED